MRFAAAVLALGMLPIVTHCQPGQPPLVPFEPDANTLLLYHFDEGEGGVAADASGHGYDGDVQGARWTAGKFGRGLRFDGQDDSVFREATEAIRDLPKITVECWFNQDDPSGRQFLMGLDVGFHFDLSGGAATSLSIYNKGGGVKNAEGLPHQHLGTGTGFLRLRRWHHSAATYDGEHISFFVDGVLKARLDAAKDFLLGAESRGFWVGCYVGDDFWYRGRIDEVRVSDCVRYDPEKRLKPGEALFEVPQQEPRLKVVRTPKISGKAMLQVAVRKLHGGDGDGWVYLKPPGSPAQIVGRYGLKGMAPGDEATYELDVSDEVAGDGCYTLGLEPENPAAYFAVIKATLSRGDEKVAQWEGQAKSRRTFKPPVLVPLQVGPRPKPEAAREFLVRAVETDRIWGDLLAEFDDQSASSFLAGDGYAEYWFDTPVAATYDVFLRYGGAAVRPCDLVIDGVDVHRYNMAARDRPVGPDARDHLWEKQGTVTLATGLHWLRIQDMPPDVSGVRLIQSEGATARKIPWGRFPEPSPSFLQHAKVWRAETAFGAVAGANAESTTTQRRSTLRCKASFPTADQEALFAGARVRFVHRGRFDLERFGRLTFSLEGAGSGHVLALRLMDAKGDEKLLWHGRDSEPGLREITVPVTFEGNDVFDPARVTAVCVELDQGNVQSGPDATFAIDVVNPRFEARGEIALADDYQARVASARGSYAPAEQTVAALRAGRFSPWTKPVVPEEHPLFASTDPRPVTREVLGYDLHFTGARSINPNTLDDYHRFHDFGDICWPHIGILPVRAAYKSDADYQKALDDLERTLVQVRDRGLLLWDIWGYVPYYPGVPQTVKPEHHEIITGVFGDRFLGYDNGEHDGRYIGAYADRGAFTDRRRGWADFVKWNEHICDDSMNYMNATGSLNFSHYYGELAHRTLGLETAQGLPSDTLMFAFLRGASKQYGRLMTQATSVWNRFGYNIHNGRKTTQGNGYGYGPNKGCSLSLHKRLMLSSYLGGHSIVGTETGQFTADRRENGAPELSPLGAQHLKIREWVRERPQRGAMATPVAFMLDFYHGWNMPRHLYRSDKYKIWGKLPYEKGDYLIDGVFRMVWPGYEDCSYLRNERGFITPTPFGDIFDVLTNRCHPDVLKQYQAIMLLGDVEMTPEVIANLRGFVADGGDLITDAAHAAQLPVELTGVRVGAQEKGCTSRVLETGRVIDELPYSYSILELAEATTLLDNENGHALVTVNATEAGRVVVGAADHWMTDRVEYRSPDLVNMEPPYLLLNGVREVLGGYFDSCNPVGVDPGGLNVRTCCFEDDPKRLLVGLLNNDLFADWEGELDVRVGDVASARDTWAGKELKPGETIRVSVPAGDAAVLDIRLR